MSGTEGSFIVLSAKTLEPEPSVPAKPGSDWLVAFPCEAQLEPQAAPELPTTVSTVNRNYLRAVQEVLIL